MKFLLVDDHAVVRRGVRELLTDEFPEANFGEASSAAEAIACVAREGWDLVVLDVALPGRSGIDVLADLHKARPGVRVVVLSMHPESEFALRALKAGAMGYIMKQSADAELVAAARKALEGGRYITATLGERLAAIVANDSPLRHDELSEREFQVFRLLARGAAVKEVAQTLGLSPKTVSTYRARVLEKLGLESTVELARYALQHRLVE